jgi:hypothetical protein
LSPYKTLQNDRITTPLVYSFLKSVTQNGQKQANLFRVPEYVGKNKQSNDKLFDEINLIEQDHENSEYCFEWGHTFVTGGIQWSNGLGLL